MKKLWCRIAHWQYHFIGGDLQKGRSWLICRKCGYYWKWN